MIDLVIIAVLDVLVVLVIRKLRRDKKAGKHSCGGNCVSKEKRKINYDHVQLRL